LTRTVHTMKKTREKNLIWDTNRGRRASETGAAIGKLTKQGTRGEDLRKRA